MKKHPVVTYNISPDTSPETISALIKVAKLAMKNETKTHYKIGGGWGDAINWFNPERFQSDYTCETRFRVVGWKSRIPEVGDTLEGDFARDGTVKFVFVEVRPCRDPRDMFFGEVCRLPKP